MAAAPLAPAPSPKRPRPDAARDLGELGAAGRAASNGDGEEDDGPKPSVTLVLRGAGAGPERGAAEARPLFTHQCFAKERGRVWPDPPPSVRVEYSPAWRLLGVESGSAEAKLDVEASPVCRAVAMESAAGGGNEDEGGEADPALGAVCTRAVLEKEDVTVYWCDQIALRPETQLFVARTQAMAVWHIESATPIFSDDPRFHLVTAVRHHRPRPRSAAEAPAVVGGGDDVVAFCTVYEFQDPITKRSSMRVCQMVVSPPHQRRGWGREILRVVYTEAASKPEVVDVTVEDPCEGFTAMRDAFDVECLMRRRLWFGEPPRVLAALVEDKSGSLVASQVDRARESVKLAPGQLQRAFEAAWLASLQDAAHAATDADWKVFRLSLKRRLFLKNRETLNEGDKEGLKAELEKLFAEERAVLERALHAARKQLARDP